MGGSAGTGRGEKPVWWEPESLPGASACLLPPPPAASHQPLQGPRQPRRQSSGSWSSASRFLPPGFLSRLLNKEGSIWSQYLCQKDSSRKAPCFLRWPLTCGDEERMMSLQAEALGASVRPPPPPFPGPGPESRPLRGLQLFFLGLSLPGAAALDLDNLFLLSLCLMRWPEKPEYARAPRRSALSWPGSSPREHVDRDPHPRCRDIPLPSPSLPTGALGWGAKKDSGRGFPSLFGSSLLPLGLRGYSWTS